MPELPDVEIERRHAKRWVVGHAIRHIHVPDPEILEDTSPAALGRRLHGRWVTGSRRHGKYLFLETDGDPWLLLHFGMTGHLERISKGAQAPEYTDFTLMLDDDSAIAYVAPRKLGRVGVIDDPDAYVAARGLGPDVLRLDREGFDELARSRRGGTKCWLMDQAAMAGLGNVYTDEILFRARLHPKTPVAALDADGLHRLFEAISEVLHIAIEAGADPARMPDDCLLRHREPGAACPRCRGVVQQLRACGRTAYFCPECQPRPDGR
ncbi:MAG: DNA-formamidopyrimidine glycosylase family protein [Thiohalocapsa sp.]|jgi:formamidopyrimidine-DNA glycosylase